MHFDNMILHGEGSEEHLPHAYRIVVGDGRDALSARRDGWEVQDTVLIITSDGRQRAAFLLCCPGKLLDGLAHDATALNVEAARKVGTGRFPANMILVHKPSCDATEKKCAEDCPAGILDRDPVTGEPIMSGNGWGYEYTRRGGKSGGGWGMTKTGTEYADVGGPSRFLATFPTDDDAILWLRLLLGKDVKPKGFFPNTRAGERE